MKLPICLSTFLVLTLTGCQKQQADVSSEPDPTIKAQFEQSDNRLSAYLDQLDSSIMSIEERTRILCKDYPKEYKTYYMPALLKLAPKEYTEPGLLKDLDNALNFYKIKANIQC